MLVYSNLGNFYPPVQFDDAHGTDYISNMFARYLGFVLQDTQQGQHPLSTQVRGVLGSAQAPLEEQALVLAVAVESLLGTFYEDAVSVSPATAAAVDNLLGFLKTWKDDPTVQKRALGAIELIKTVRAGDQLKALVEGGVVRQSGCSEWKSLRHSVAHGDWHMVDDLQDMIDRIGHVRVLFYQLVFHLIGYSGKQTDYGTRDWPLVDYPPHVSSPPPPGS